MIRIAAALFVIALLLVTYAGRVAVGDGNPFDYVGNQTSLLAAVVLMATGALALGTRRPPTWSGTAPPYRGEGCGRGCLIRSRGSLSSSSAVRPAGGFRRDSCCPSALAVTLIAAGAMASAGSRVPALLRVG
jgi:hypothetical protein